MRRPRADTRVADTEFLMRANYIGELVYKWMTGVYAWWGCCRLIGGGRLPGERCHCVAFTAVVGCGDWYAGGTIYKVNTWA